MGFVNERLGDGTWRTIDMKRNIVLRTLGGGRPKEPTEFEIVIDGSSFKFQALQRTKNLHNIKKVHVEWDIWEVCIPPQADLEKPAVLKIIEEALHGYGFAASTDLVASLNVNFPKSI